MNPSQNPANPDKKKGSGSARTFKSQQKKHLLILLYFPIPHSNPANEFVFILTVKPFCEHVAVFNRRWREPIHGNRSNCAVYIYLDALTLKFFLTHLVFVQIFTCHPIQPVHCMHIDLSIKKTTSVKSRPRSPSGQFDCRMPILFKKASFFRLETSRDVSLLSTT